MDKVRAYQDAYRINEDRRLAVKQMVTAMSDISSACQWHLRSFLGFNFNIKIDDRPVPFDRKGRIDLSTWPSAADAKEMFSQWNESDSTLRAVWQQLTAEERHGLQPPPRDMSL